MREVKLGGHIEWKKEAGKKAFGGVYRRCKKKVLDNERRKSETDAHVLYLGKIGKQLYSQTLIGNE